MKEPPIILLPMSDTAVLSMRNGLQFFQSGVFVANADGASDLPAPPKEFNVKCDAALHLFTTLPAPAYQLSLLIPHSSAATTAPHSRSRACRLAPGRNGWSALLLLLSWATRGRCAALHPSLALLNTNDFPYSSARYLMLSSPVQGFPLPRANASFWLLQGILRAL